MLPPDGPYTAQIAACFEPDWYQTRYPDALPSGLEPLQHFLRYGLAERRDPNRFFDSDWYVEHNPDVAASGLNPLLHYLRAGAEELRNPNPRFDAKYYVQQHPGAAANPLMFHVRIGQQLGLLTEKPFDILDYLPSSGPRLVLRERVFADVIIPVHQGFDSVRRCILSVLADRGLPLARIIVIDDRVTEPGLSAWLKALSAEGQIYLIRNARHLGFAASAALGIQAAETHDVAVLSSDSEVPAGWLSRLAAHAYTLPNIATVSPFCLDSEECGYPDGHGAPLAPARIDALCLAVNTGRSADVPAASFHCVYVRRAAQQALGSIAEADFYPRATAAGWIHRIACDVFVSRRGGEPDALEAVTPFRFALTAALFSEAKLPVVIMISHHYGGGVRRHIDSLAERYRGSARVLLLTGSDHCATLSVASIPDHPELTLPADRLDDLIAVLRSMQVSRVHVHHLLEVDIDIRSLIQRLGVPFDTTVHDYFAICPQVNLLRWTEALYCGEPGPASCNACIAEQSSHGARDIVSWRRDHAWQFLNAERVICPSADTKSRIDRYYPGAPTIVVPHEQQSETSWASLLPYVADGPLRIVLLGVMANHKGARVMAEVAEAAEPGTIEIHLIGELEQSFPSPDLHFVSATGKYRESDLPDLLKKIDPHVVWFPSSTPETFSFTLSVAIATGLPIVATDLGSFTERLAGRPRSWLVDYRATAEDWLATFADVRKALVERADKAPAPRPVQISDFYADRYLDPEPKATFTWPAGKRRAASARKRRVAIVPERFPSGGLTPGAYIRLLQPFDHLGDVEVILADSKTIFDCKADIVVTQRWAIPNMQTANRLADYTRRIGAKLLYDLDDDLLEDPEAGRLRAPIEVAHLMLTVADAVWVSTNALAERLAMLRPDAMVVEDRLDERIWARAPAPDMLWDHPVRILCMGSATHERDFAVIEPALLRLKDEYGHMIAIDVLGLTKRSELPEGLNRIVPNTHATRSYPGFVNWLTATQPRWHIGLAPLPETNAHRCKSPISAIEYAALGLTVLASDTPVYRGSIADGPAGQLIANNPVAWHAALDWLIRNQELRQARVAQAHQAFLASGTLASQGDIRRLALATLLQDGTSDLRRGAGALTIPYDPPDPVTRKRRAGSRGR